MSGWLSEDLTDKLCSDSRVKYACFVWAAYALVLISKVATCFRLFYEDIPATPLDNNDKLFDDFLFKAALSLSVLIFLFVFESHHYTPLVSVRQVYISYLVAAICLDLIDNIYFLDLLWQASVRTRGIIIVLALFFRRTSGT